MIHYESPKNEGSAREGLPCVNAIIVCIEEYDFGRNGEYLNEVFPNSP